MHCLRRSLVVGLLVVASASLGGAQVIETPVPFDSTGQVLQLTPAIAARLGLAPPSFQVQGTFTTARLYASSSGGHVLVVERPTGVVERYLLTDTDIAALRGTITTALAAGGGRIPAETELPSQPAARQFVRNQVLLGFLLYGPNLAALANDAKTGTVLYLLGVGGTYFGIAALTRENTITRAQNRLATDGAIRGWLAANGLLTAMAGDIPDGKTVAGVGLAGAVGGALGGLAHGRGLSDAEAKAATSGSSFGALTMGGILGTLLYDQRNVERTVAGLIVGAGALGYALGPRYPRSTTYRVTVGDINTMWIGAALGAATAMVPIMARAEREPEVGYAAATVGMLGGAWLAERGWVRPYDHSGSDVMMLWLGTIAGGLVGGAAIVLVEPDEPSVGLALVTAGAAAGALITHKMLGVAPAGTRSARLGGAEVELSASSLAFAASRLPGTHPVVRIRF